MSDNKTIVSVRNVDQDSLKEVQIECVKASRGSSYGAAVRFAVDELAKMIKQGTYKPAS